MTDRILSERHAWVACRWCGVLFDHMKDHQCETGKYAAGKVKSPVRKKKGEA